MDFQLGSPPFDFFSPGGQVVNLSMEKSSQTKTSSTSTLDQESYPWQTLAPTPTDLNFSSAQHPPAGLTERYGDDDDAVDRSLGPTLRSNEREKRCIVLKTVSVFFFFCPLPLSARCLRKGNRRHGRGQKDRKLWLPERCNLASHQNRRLRPDCLN